MLWAAAFLLAQAEAPAPAVRRAADAILLHQASDGALVMGRLPAKSSHLIPYCANFAAHGLAAAHGATRDPRHLEAARRWVRWYEDHMNADGTICDFDGAPGAWKSTGDFDSTDSYAATFLDLLAAVQDAAPDVPWLRARLPAARKAVAGIRLTLQPNGLTGAKPRWPVMYVMDNTETARGLRAAGRLAAILKEPEMERESADLAAAMERAVARDLWDDAGKCYVVGIHPDGARPRGLAKWYPDVMANLMAAGWLPPAPRHRDLLALLKERFPAEIPAAVRAEGDLDRLCWWGIAARGTGDDRLLEEVRGRLERFDENLKSFSNPGLLGHLCRLLSPGPRPR